MAKKSIKKTAQSKSVGTKKAVKRSAKTTQSARKPVVKKAVAAVTASVQQAATKSKKVAKKITKKVTASTKKTLDRTKKTIEKTTKISWLKGIPMIAIGVFAVLFLISVGMLVRQSSRSSDILIVQDVQELKQVMQSIHQDCKILSLEHTKNYIDFLTVKEFVGSEVGAMNLAYPQNWKGPYVKDNPTVQQRQYVILKTEKGYFIVPGDGVKLGNGKKIGTDIVLDSSTDVAALLQDSEGLKSEQGSLGTRVDIGTSFIQKVLHKPLRYL